MIPSPTIDGITLFGTFKIYFYGIVIMLGALAATWLAAKRAKMYGQDMEEAWDILPWALIGGIIGARLWHILTPTEANMAQGLTTSYYFTHPLEILNLRKGGLGIPGAVIGGFLAVWAYVRRKDQSILSWADIIAPGLALAQAIGRLGNYFNQEVYGMPTNLPWSLIVSPDRRLIEYSNVATYHPLFLYELLWNLLNAGLLIWISRRFRDVLRRGDLFLIYAIFYSFGRFWLEFLRLDPSPVAGINVNQTIMAVICVGAALIMFLRHRLVANEPLSIAVEKSQSEDAPAGDTAQ